MGSLKKCWAIYEKPFWREKNLNGLGVAIDDRATIMFDISPDDASRGYLLGFMT